MVEQGGRFRWRGLDLEYLVHPYNKTAQNERAVEVPIALAFIDGRAGVGVEVGNVIGHYVEHSHRVVDLYETAAGVDNVDLFDLTGSFDWIVAISTIEHVRWEAPPWDEQGPMDAVAHLRSLLAPGGELLVTAPFGQHPHLDKAIESGEMHPDTQGCLLWQEDHWVPVEDDVVYLPARPLRWASSVWVATWVA